MANAQEVFDQRTAQDTATANSRLAQDQATYNQRQAELQNTYNQRQQEAQNTYNARLAESQNKITDMYGKALEAQKQQYKTALDQGIAAQEEARAGIAKTYQTSANDLAVQYERNKRNLDAQALAHGLNTGTASQQQLALNQGYMKSYGKLRGEESAQNAGIDRSIASLNVDYQNNISQALANNDYQKAAALMDDYNNKLNWLDAQRANNQSYFDTGTANNRNYLDNATGNYRNYLDSSVTNNRNWLDSENRYQDQMNASKAETLASYGDFSGYEALGYDSSTINNMRQIWIAQNPLLAYNTGAISAERYMQMTGEAPPGVDMNNGGGGGYYGGGYYDPSEPGAIGQGVNNVKVSTDKKTGETVWTDANGKEVYRSQTLSADAARHMTSDQLYGNLNGKGQSTNNNGWSAIKVNTSQESKDAAAAHRVSAYKGK